MILSTGKNYAQGGVWVWVNGSDTARPDPIYGVQGVADINNVPRGVWSAANWIDTAGNFWIYGGIYDSFGYRTTYTETLSDLWRYEPSKNIWTWMKGPGKPNVPPTYGSQGTPSPENNPGSKIFGFLCWTDKNDDLWLYGGDGPQSSNDLWRYNLSSNEWTWMNGSDDGKHFAAVYGNFLQPSPLNSPGNRAATSAAWVDEDNNLWLFGGGGTGQYNYYYDDVWRYNITSNEWTWMKGPQGTQLWGSAGNYGIKGVESPLNNPPTRINFSNWKDKGGNFYIYGGYYGLGVVACLNDVWKYNPVTNNWTWIAGDSTPNISGIYNQFCDTQLNIPVGRAFSSSPQTLTCSDNFYVAGGTSNIGIPETGILSLFSADVLNDLWVYNAENKNWKWLSGSSGYNDLGNYGVKGVPASTNQMPARYGQCTWVDKQGVLWVFGGIGVDTMLGGSAPCCQMQTKNDLWKFIPDTSCVQIRCNTTPTSDSVDLFVPNAFTPNNDGINDRLTVFAKNISVYDIKIFDRWGELVYTSHDVSELNDTTKGWDGSYKGVIQNPGVFVFSVTVQDMNGKVFSKKGSVTLLR